MCKNIVNLVITFLPATQDLIIYRPKQKPILLVLGNSQLIGTGWIAHRMSTYAVKVDLQLSSRKNFHTLWGGAQWRKSDFLWGISFSRSLVLPVDLTSKFLVAFSKVPVEWIYDFQSDLKLQLPCMLELVFKDGDGNDWKLSVCYGFIDSGTGVWRSHWGTQLSTAEQNHFMSVTNLRDQELNSHE